MTDFSTFGFENTSQKFFFKSFSDTFFHWTFSICKTTSFYGNVWRPLWKHSKGAGTMESVRKNVCPDVTSISTSILIFAKPHFARIFKITRWNKWPQHVVFFTKIKQIIWWWWPSRHMNRAFKLIL